MKNIDRYSIIVKRGASMTVIMGCKKSNKIYLGADNRTSTIDNQVIRDNEKKIVVVNNHVAVAFSGVSDIQHIFEKQISDLEDRDTYVVEDVIKHLKRTYWLLKLFSFRKNIKQKLCVGSRFIIAGKNRENEYCLYIMSYVNGKLEKPKLVESFMFPPSDVSPKDCYDYYARNVYSHKDFIQKTVKDISRMSKLVSSSGDMWVYDMITDKSVLEHFF